MKKDGTIKLPSGGWAKLKDPTSLRVKDRNKVLRYAGKEEGLMQALSILDGLIALLIEEWSFEMPIPSIKIQSLGELTLPDYDTLSAEAQKAQETLFPKLTETEETKEDVESPFADSND